jgi:hypothetical protein
VKANKQLVGVISILMLYNFMRGSNLRYWRSVQGEQNRTKNRPLGNTPRACYRIRLCIPNTYELLSLSQIGLQPFKSETIDTKTGSETFQKDRMIDGIEGSTEIKRHKNRR